MSQPRFQNSNPDGVAQRAHFTPSKNFHRQLKAYALAAGAAGVGVFAIPSANADIVFTPVHTSFTDGRLFLDLDHDGHNDFFLSIYNFCSICRDRRLTAVGVGRPDGVLGTIGSSYSPLALKTGDRIGPGEVFYQHEGPAANVAATFGTVISGPFPNVGVRYLGLRFTINGENHFGWAAINVKAVAKDHRAGIKVTLLGFAYETVAGQSILAGQIQAKSTAPVHPHATLGMLALGSPGLRLWRRKNDL